MAQHHAYDAVVVGAGPNGLAAAITLAQAGRSVLVREAAPTLGGGTRSAELTLPGFIHDICAAIMPLGVASPFLRTLPLHEHGLEWVYSPAVLAHPFDDGTAVVMERSVEATAASLGSDAGAYRKLIEPIVRDWPRLERGVLGPFTIPRHPFAMARFGLVGLRSADAVARRAFQSDRARTFFAGHAGHAIQPLEFPATAAFGLLIAVLGHVVGWPLAGGGSQRVADAMASYLRSLGGEIITDARVNTLAELPPARALLLDVTPRQLLEIAGERLPAGYRRKLQRYRYGPGVYKIDWALDGPIPWRSQECLRAATIHLGGSFDEIKASERKAFGGEHAERPFVLLAQQSLFDHTRAPAGKHTAWAYCHVPNGTTWNMTERIEAQVERFAPGFRDRILARHTFSPAEMERHDANYIGGDINGGVQDLRQLWTRPTARIVPYSTPAKGIYICSSSTPPGGGVHGLCGYFAAKAALRADP